MWSRVTLVDEERRVDAVLPAREPIGALMPDLLDLLGDQARHPARLRHLVTAAGEVLTGEATLAESAVPDGSVLRLLRADEPLPAPVVHDVPEAVDDAVGGRPWRWSPRAAEWTAIVTTAALGLSIALVLHRSLGGTAGPVAIGAAAVATLVGGMATGIAWRAPFGTALTLCGGTMAGVGLWAAADLQGWQEWARWGGLAVLAGLLLAALGLTSGLGRGGLAGGGLTAALGLAWAACAGSGLGAVRTGAVLAVATVVLLSVMLRAALSLSGLAALDDRRSADAPAPRGDVLAALTAAHRTLVIATAAVAVAAVVAGWAPAVEFGAWSVALAVLLAIVVASRARMFPLIPQKAVLFAAALLIWVNVAYQAAGQAAWAALPALGMLLALLVIPVVVLTSRQPEHLRARLRRIANRIEAVAVVALLPVAIGTFGVFERLLDTF
ncbi:EsaB/YukD family protein [Spirillospora sp. CA-255316]